MQYYYLISSLPVVNINPDDNSLDLNELYDLIQRNLSEKDLLIYQAILYQNDNRNLLSLIFREYQHIEFDYIYKPSVIPFKSLLSYRRNLSVLPDYMILFLQDNAGIFSSISLTDIELKLRKYFMEYIRTLNSEFLLQYYEWQYHLEETISTINQQKFNFLNPRGSHDTDFLSTCSMKFHQVDKNEISAELSPLMEELRFSDIERTVDRFYWEFAESWSDVFSENRVFSYVVKLLRLSRWSDISKDPGEVMGEFKRLLEKIKKSNRSPKTAVV